MARIFIGNIKGPQGERGPQGEQGPVGPQGPQGPLPPLVNNALVTEAGVSALDAAMGKTLQDQITDNKDDITQLYSNMPVLFKGNILLSAEDTVTNFSRTLTLEKNIVSAVASARYTSDLSTRKYSVMTDVLGNQVTIRVVFEEPVSQGFSMNVYYICVAG